MQSAIDTEARELLRATVAAFVERECPDVALREWDERGEVPPRLFRIMAQAGWAGLTLSEEFGGSGAQARDLVVVGEELSRASYDLATGLGLTVFTAMNVEHHGSSDLKARLLPAVCRGDTRFAVAITEPESGSDAGSLRTTGVVDGDTIVLSGQKMFCTGAHLPGTLLAVACRTASGERKHDGISVVLVPNDARGVNLLRVPTLGRRMVGTNAVSFDEVRVPLANVVGALGDGWDVVISGLLIERLYVSACYLGSAAALLRLAVEYAKERRQFGHPIGEFQAIAHQLGDAAAALWAARALTYQAADSYDAGCASAGEVAAAKLVGSEMWMRVADTAMQVFGGYGYVTDAPVQRHFRDSRAAAVTAGTSQIQRTLIARSLGLGASSRS